MIVEESVDSTLLSSELLERRWIQLLQHHLLSGRKQANGSACVGFTLPASGEFRGEVRAGRFGTLRFCHLRMAPHRFEFVGDAGAADLGHMVVLQLSGNSVFATKSQTERLRPGDLLLIDAVPVRRAEHQTPVEQLVLLQPLARADMQGLARRGLFRRDALDGLERMTFRWLRDACLGCDWAACEVSDDVARALGRLLAHVLRNGGEKPQPHRPKLTRALVEDYIADRLSDAAINVASIAKAFGCSTRTLHRVFLRDGGESIERTIWRRRLEACAEILRSPSADTLSLTELALHWGFSNPTHFAGAFRRHFGISPSGYRRRALEG